MAASRTKIARELSAEELEEFLAMLRGEKGLTGKRLQELCSERGIKIGHDAAATFLKQEFKPYLERLTRTSRLARFIEENSDSKAATSIADAAASELSQAVYELLAVSELDVDMQTDEGMERAKSLSLIVSRIRRGDHTQRALEAKLAEMEEQRETMKKALDGDEVKKGVSIKAQNELRRSLGMDPLKEAA